MSTDVTTTWLRVAAGAVLVFGLIIAASASPGAAGITQFLLDLIFWPVDGTPTLNTPEARLLCAISGGVMAGWGLMLWLVASRLYAREPELARSLILYSVATWFVIDSTGSIIAGAPLNAVFNIGFMLLFWFPLRPSNRSI